MRPSALLFSKLLVIGLCGVLVLTATVHAENLPGDPGFEFEDKNVGIVPASFSSRDRELDSLETINNSALDLSPLGASAYIPLNSSFDSTDILSPTFHPDVSSTLYKNFQDRLTPLRSLPKERFKGSPWELADSSSVTGNLAYKLHLIGEQIGSFAQEGPWTGFQWFLIVCLVSLTLSLGIGLYSTHDFLQKELILMLGSSENDNKVRAKRKTKASTNKGAA